MARIRTIKPEFWTDERVGECSPNARLLFVGMWNFADDHGGIERSARQLKAQIYPYDSIDCEPLIQELLSAGLLIEYEVEGKKYLHIKGFRLHQKVEKPGKPRVPLYECAPNIPRIFTEDSPNPLDGREGKGIGREDKTPPISPPRGGGVPKRRVSRIASEIAPDFALDEQLRQFAVSRFPDCDVEAAFEQFRSHHLAKGTKSKDWGASWRTWVGNFSQYGYPKRRVAEPTMLFAGRPVEWQ